MSRLDPIDDSQIAYTDPNGGPFIIRGYDMKDLVINSTFEEMIHLLIFKQLPTSDQLKALIKKISTYRIIPSRVKEIVEKVPLSEPVSMLINAFSTLSIEIDEENMQADEIALRIISLIGPINAYWYRFHTSKGVERIETYTGPEDTIAKNFLILLGVHVTPEKITAIDFILKIFSEVTLGPPSIFAGRIAASTQATFLHSFVAFIAGASGKRHIGAIRSLVKLYSTFESKSIADNIINNILKEKGIVFGFGNPFFEFRADPRAPLFLSKINELSAYKDDRFDIFMEVMNKLEKEKRLFPNPDFFSSVMMHLCKVPSELYFNVLIMARGVGSCTHIIEQRERPYKNMFGKSFVYKGPKDLKYQHINERMNPKF